MAATAAADTTVDDATLRALLAGDDGGNDDVLGDRTTYRNDDEGQLMQWLVNERCAPDILPYQGEILENLTEMLSAQQENIDAAAPDSSTVVLLVTLYQHEMERVRFLIRNYLRTRLAKIHRFPLHILQNDDLRQRLSVHELDFVERFQHLLEKHFNASCLDDLPPFLRQLQEHTVLHDMVARPDLESAVICKVNRDVGSVLLPHNGETITMRKNNIYILRYNAIKDLLLVGDVSLV